MSNHLTKISAEQRVDMITNGLNPMNPENVERYLNGDNRKAVQENKNRIEAIMGGKLKANLGHAKEKATNFDNFDERTEYNPSLETGIKSNQNNTDYRTQINQDMQSYQNNNENLGAVPNLINLRESQPISQQNQGGNVIEVATRLMTEYYNAFVISLQKPSTKANMEVFRALKKVLEQEQALKTKPNALKLFQESTRTVTSEMYISLKG